MLLSSSLTSANLSKKLCSTFPLICSWTSKNNIFVVFGKRYREALLTIPKHVLLCWTIPTKCPCVLATRFHLKVLFHDKTSAQYQLIIKIPVLIPVGAGLERRHHICIKHSIYNIEIMNLSIIFHIPLLFRLDPDFLHGHPTIGFLGGLLLPCPLIELEV